MMNVDQARLIEYNVVTVFRELRFTQVLLELSRRLLPEHPAPLITEIPGQLLSVVYPDRRIDCQFANRRVQVTDKRAVTPGEHPLGMIAINAVEAASQSSGGRGTIIAHGWNYTLHLPETNATQYIAARFFRDAAGVSGAFGGELQGIGFGGTARIPQRGCLVNFSVGPVPGSTNLIQATANYHYEGQAPPPSSQEISEQTDQHYSEFLQVLRGL